MYLNFLLTSRTKVPVLIKIKTKIKDTKIPTPRKKMSCIVSYINMSLHEINMR